MKLRVAQSADFARIARWNRQLQEDEGAEVMSPAAIETRLKSWLSDGYQAAIFTLDYPVGYALYRHADPDSEGVGIYIRQFYIDRAERRKGYGRAAFRLLSDQLVGERRVILEVLDLNQSGHAFWRSLGFKPYSTKYEAHLGRGA